MPKSFDDISVADFKAYQTEKVEKTRLAYAKRMGKRLAMVTKQGEARTDLGVAQCILRQYGVFEAYFADAIVAGRMIDPRLGEQNV